MPASAALAAMMISYLCKHGWGDELHSTEQAESSTAQQRAARCVPFALQPFLCAEVHPCWCVLSFPT